MANYWRTRDIIQREALLDKSIADTERELASQYKKTLNKVKRDMTALYDEIKAESENGTVQISDLYRFNRYYDLLNTINQSLLKLGLKEQLIYDRGLTNLYRQNEKLIGRQLGLAAAVDETAAEKVVKAIWCSDGQHWSDRIWAHKTDLANRLERGLIDCFSRGASHDELTKQIMDDFSVSFNNADRIARTELSYIQNQSTLDSYRAAGVTQYQYLAELDAKSCDVCGSLDGQRFDLDAAEPGVNLPPLHPNCRCTILAVLN